MRAGCFDKSAADEGFMTAREWGQKTGHQSGWNSKEEAWRYAKEEIKHAKGSATGSDKKEFMAGWKSVRTGGRSRNPLPVGRYVTVKAIRRKNGRIEIYQA
jgi:hypothetical protein